jgi:transcriptional regulator with XRE-family HTH domain
MNRTIYSKEHKRIVEQLKKARERAGLSQEEVAKILGKTQSYISKIEAGQRKINVIQLKGFAKIYKKDISYFLKS